MTKRIRLWLIIALVSGGAAAAIKLWQAHSDAAWARTQLLARTVRTEQQWKDYARRHPPRIVVDTNKAIPLSGEVERIAPSRRIRLAVGWLGFPDESQNRQIADLVVAQLNSETNLELVDRQSLDAVLQESALNLSGLVRADRAVRLGKLLRADWFLLGSSTVVHGTNCTVARVVDSATGIMRDIALLPPANDPQERARALAEFVWQCRASASSSRPRTYLAIGDFEDVGMNSHQADFGEQLRSFLLAAFRANTNVTILERDGVEALLLEMRMDLAGLTEEPDTNRRPQIQSAVWAVDGYYQAYENQGWEVELDLHIQPAFGRELDAPLRGTPGDVFFHVVEMTLAKALADAPQAAYVPSRRREILEAQKIMTDRCPLPSVNVLAFPLGSLSWYYFTWDEKGTPAQIRHDREEGLRATQRLLLLDPTNRPAMLYMAVYLQDPVLQRDEEARSFFKEVADFPANDRLSAVALADLAANLVRTDSKEALRVLKAARERFKTDLGLLDFLTDQRMFALSGERLSSDSNSDDHALQLARQQPFVHLHRTQDNWMIARSFIYPENDIGDFILSFGPRRAAGVESFLALLPTLKEKFPALAPYFILSAFYHQTNSENPYAEDTAQAAEFCAEHPDTVIEPDILFNYVSGLCVNWCLNCKQYDLAVRLLHAKGHALARAAQMNVALNALSESAAARSNLIASLRPTVLPLTNAAPPRPNDSPTNADTLLLSAHDKISLYRIYARMERWQDALSVVDSIEKRPAPFSGDLPYSPPWEPGTIPGYTNDADATCRKKLGLPLAADDKLFSLGDPCLRLDSPFAFSADSQGIRVASGPRLIRLTFDLMQQDVTPISDLDGAADTVICPGPTQLWIGTDGNGLLEYDQASHKVLRRWSEPEGLYSGHISRLCLDKNVLWVGFGYQGKGALGRVDLASGKVSALTPRLRPEPPRYGPRPLSTSEPPGEAITGLSLGSPGEIYLCTPHQVLRYRVAEDNWEDLSVLRSQLDLLYTKNAGLAFDGARIFVNQTSSGYIDTPSGQKPLAGGGLAVQTLAKGQWQHLGAPDGLPLPNSTAMAFNGKDLWLGGRGYIALIDLEKKTVRKRAYMQANSVDHLAVAGGFLWAQFDGNLCRISPSVAD